MFINFSTKKITILLFCSSVLVACTTPPKRQPPLSAEQLARTHLQLRPPVANQPTAPIAVLPPTQSQPLKEVSKNGQMPTVTTMIDQTLEKSDLNTLSDEITFEFNHEQTDLRHIIEFVGKELKINMAIDPTIGDKVTLSFSEENPLKKQDLWPFLQLLLNNAGISITKKGNVYHFKKTGQSTLPGTIGMTPKALTRSASPEVLQITPLRYITAEAAQQVINPLIQPEKGRILTLPTLNIIGIITSPQSLERINKLLTIIDADPFLHRGMRLFRLLNSKATDVQADLDKILKALYGKSQPTYEAIALERINALLVIAPPNGGFNEVALWVEVLDERIEDTGEQIFIYKVRNLEASKLATTLSNVFKVEDKKTAEEKERLKKLREKEEQEKSAKKEEEKQPVTPIGSPIAVSAELKVTIVADESTNSLLIRATPRDYKQLLGTIHALDQVPKEVMVNVVLAEVTLTEANKFGVDWQFFFGGNDRSYMQTDFNVPGAGDQDNPLTGFVVKHIAGSLNAILNLVASTNDFSILSRPSLLVRDNEEATINVGSNEPFLGSIDRSSINTSNLVSQDVQYKDTGITVKVTPRINEDGIINMKIFQELSQLGPTRTTQNLQSFITRKIETNVVVRDGSAIVIGGLIETRKKNDNQSIPGLRDIPMIGNWLFNSTDQQEDRTELVLIIVPQIVNPEVDNRPVVQDFLQRMDLVSQLLSEEYVFRKTAETTQEPSPESSSVSPSEENNTVPATPATP